MTLSRACCNRMFRHGAPRWQTARRGANRPPFGPRPTPAAVWRTRETAPGNPPGAGRRRECRDCVSGRRAGAGRRRLQHRRQSEDLTKGSRDSTLCVPGSRRVGSWRGSASVVRSRQPVACPMPSAPSSAPRCRASTLAGAAAPLRGAPRGGSPHVWHGGNRVDTAPRREWLASARDDEPEQYRPAGGSRGLACPRPADR